MPSLDTRERPLADLRISVTDRCNFRCPHCMPKTVFGPGHPFLDRHSILTYEEITRLARVFVGLGIRKIRLTGGEPLLRRELPKLVAMLVAIPGLEDLGLTTNGVFLAEQAADLKAAGLHRVTVSLDSLDDEVFRRTNDVDSGVAPVLAGIEAASRAGLHPVKINAVIKRGVNDHTVVDLARHFRGSGHVVRFIEYMDVGNNNGWRLEEVVPADEILKAIDAEMPLTPTRPSYRGEVARRWRYRDGSGEIGVIASVSQPFCGDCSRARLSPEGRLYTCLFAESGHDLRTPLRNGTGDDDLARTVAGIWRRRGDRYSELRSAGTPSGPKVEMSYIGG